MGRQAFLAIEGLFNRIFGTRLNPFYHLGSLTIFFFWVVLVSGIYLFIFFETSVQGAYQSVEQLTHDQWWAGGIMRSLHRYASDAAVVTMILHLVREFSRDRYRSFRWFSWITGVPLAWLVALLGITGYWVVWDMLAQYVAVLSAELMDWLPLFTDSIARNFLTEGSVDDRFFTLMGFLHFLGLPVFLLLAVWLHVVRISGPRVNPPRALAVGSLVAMTALSLVWPVISHAPADLDQVPMVLHLDWFYLAPYPLLDYWSRGAVWALLLGATLLLMLLPWLPPKRLPATAQVDLEECNGCGRCYADCPYSAIDMRPRSERGDPADQVAVVDPALCANCGICAGACPSAMPFRRVRPLPTGIDLPDLSVTDLEERIGAALADREAPRILAFTCDHGPAAERLAGAGTGTISLHCAGQLPPSFIDYALRKQGAEGIFVTGCRHGDCHFRQGNEIIEQRIAGVRETPLRPRVNRRRVRVFWPESRDTEEAATALAGFREDLEALLREEAETGGAADDDPGPEVEEHHGRTGHG